MMEEEKTVWDRTFDLNQAEVQGQQILSALKLLFQNISDQFYNNPILHTFDTFPSQDIVFNISNLTPLFSHTYKTDDPFLDSGIDFLYMVFPYWIKMLLFMGTLWVVNKLVFKVWSVTDFSETLGSIILSLPVLPFVFAFFSILVSLRVVISTFLKVFSKGKKSLLKPVDGFWAYETYASCSACTGMYIIDGPCKPEVVRQRIKSTIESDLVGGKMSRKIGSFLGFPCWEDCASMDMMEYIKVVKDDSTGRVNYESDVFEVMEKAQDSPIVDRAPWEVYLVPNFRYKNASNSKKQYYAAIFRIHHSIMDGISTANILHSCMADKPFEFSFDPVSPDPKLKKVSFLKTYLPFVAGFFTIPRVALRNLFLVDNYNNKYYSPGPPLTGPKTFTWTRPIRMDVIKEIKNVTKTSFLCVASTALGGAYRQLYLKQFGRKPESDFFHVMSPTALLPYSDRKPKNQFSGVLLRTYVGEESSPLQRLYLNYENMKKFGSTSADFTVVANWYYPYMLGLMPYFMHKVLAPLMHLKMSLSNVPGPKDKNVVIYEGGKINDIGIWLPIKLSIGMGMGLFSYGDRVRATLIGDKACFPKDSHVKFIAEAFERELVLLAKAAKIEDHEDSIFLPDD